MAYNFTEPSLALAHRQAGFIRAQSHVVTEEPLVLFLSYPAEVRFTVLMPRRIRLRKPFSRIILSAAYVTLCWLKDMFVVGSASRELAVHGSTGTAGEQVARTPILHRVAGVKLVTVMVNN